MATLKMQITTRKIIWGVLGFLVLILGVTFALNYKLFAYTYQKVTNFEECQKAGGPILDGPPKNCFFNNKVYLEKPLPAPATPANTADTTYTSNWKSYKNAKYGFEISYPESWTLKENFSNAEGYFITNNQSTLAILPRGEFDYGLPLSNPIVKNSQIANKQVTSRQWDLKNDSSIFLYQFTDVIPNWIICKQDLKNCNRIDVQANSKENLNILLKILSTFKFTPTP